MELFSTEFYVLMFTLAACCVGLIVKPGRRGQAETSFTEATVLDRETDITPRVEFRCLENGNVAIIRHGLAGITSAATVALAITRTGFDISIEERVTPRAGGEPAERASFIIDGLGPERYHIKYNAPVYSLFMATTLPVKPGIAFTRNLTQM